MAAGVKIDARIFGQKLSKIAIVHLRDKEEFTSFTVAFWLVQFHGSGSFLHEIGLVQRPRHSTHFSVFSLPFAQQLSQAEQARQRVCTQIVRGITRSV